VAGRTGTGRAGRTYARRDYRQDGSAHHVRLKTSRKGVEQRYRPGYFADAAK
jgi:hypothetical protein